MNPDIALQKSLEELIKLSDDREIFSNSISVFFTSSSVILLQDYLLQSSQIIDLAGSFSYIVGNHDYFSSIKSRLSDTKRTQDSNKKEIKNKKNLIGELDKSIDSFKKNKISEEDELRKKVLISKRHTTIESIKRLESSIKRKGEDLKKEKDEKNEWISKFNKFKKSFLNIYKNHCDSENNLLISIRKELKLFEGNKNIIDCKQKISKLKRTLKHHYDEIYKN